MDEATLGATGPTRSLLRPRRSDFCGSTSLSTNRQAGPKLIFSAQTDDGLVPRCLASIKFERAEEASMLAAPS